MLFDFVLVAQTLRGEFDIAFVAFDGFLLRLVDFDDVLVQKILAPKRPSRTVGTKHS